MKLAHMVTLHVVVIAMLAFVDPFLSILYQAGIVVYLLTVEALRLWPGTTKS
jgi:hypothetical protein